MFTLWGGVEHLGVEAHAGHDGEGAAVSGDGLGVLDGPDVDAAAVADGGQRDAGRHVAGFGAFISSSLWPESSQTFVNSTRPNR